jgi:hypothetical protein
MQSNAAPCSSVLARCIPLVGGELVSPQSGVTHGTMQAPIAAALVNTAPAKHRHSRCVLPRHAHLLVVKRRGVKSDLHSLRVPAVASANLQTPTPTG